MIKKRRNDTSTNVFSGEGFFKSSFLLADSIANQIILSNLLSVASVRS